MNARIRNKISKRYGFKSYKNYRKFLKRINRNKRYYSADTLKKAIRNMDPRIFDGKFTGDIQHPEQYPVVENFDKSSMYIAPSMVTFNLFGGKIN